MKGHQYPFSPLCTMCHALLCGFLAPLKAKKGQRLKDNHGGSYGGKSCPAHKSFTYLHAMFPLFSHYFPSICPLFSQYFPICVHIFPLFSYYLSMIFPLLCHMCPTCFLRIPSPRCFTRHFFHMQRPVLQRISVPGSWLVLDNSYGIIGKNTDSY